MERKANIALVGSPLGDDGPDVLKANDEIGRKRAPAIGDLPRLQQIEHREQQQRLVRSAPAPLVGIDAEGGEAG